MERQLGSVYLQITAHFGQCRVCELKQNAIVFFSLKLFRCRGVFHHSPDK